MATLKKLNEQAKKLSRAERRQYNNQHLQKFAILVTNIGSIIDLNKCLDSSNFIIMKR